MPPQSLHVDIHEFVRLGACATLGHWPAGVALDSAGADQAAAIITAGILLTADLQGLHCGCRQVGAPAWAPQRPCMLAHACDVDGLIIGLNGSWGTTCGAATCLEKLMMLSAMSLPVA